MSNHVSTADEMAATDSSFEQSARAAVFYGRGFRGVAKTSYELHTLGESSTVAAEPNKKIVVIDDDPSVQEVVRAYLEKDGYLVFVAGTAGEGLALAARIKPGLVVLDLMLPDRPGEEVAARSASARTSRS